MAAFLPVRHNRALERKSEPFEPACKVVQRESYERHKHRKGKGQSEIDTDHWVGGNDCVSLARYFPLMETVFCALASR